MRRPRDASSTTEMSTPVLSNSFTGSVWTVVSRGTGLIKTIAVGAVLGATYLGNTYQTINSLPNLVYYQLLAGSLFASLLVPPLVRHVDEGDRERAQKLVSGFLGALLLVALAGSVVLVALGPGIMHLLTLSVHDHATATAQTRVGWYLLAMFVPQIALYVVAGTGAAVMNANGRFALAAAAPALESFGMILVLVTAGLMFGSGTGIIEVSNAELLLLGLGTTGAVALHATCQWWGSRRSGYWLVPRAGWRDPEIRRVLRRIPPTLAYTGLAALQIFAVMVVANSVQGGFVAFQLGLNFFYLPTAVITWPVARALLPQLARFHNAGDEAGFRDEFRRAVAVASFVTMPIGAAYLALAPALAHAMAFGQLQKGSGVTMLSVSLASLAPGLICETWFILGTYGLYARHDVRAPLRSMAVRVGVSLALMSLAWVLAGSRVLLVLGLTLSAGSLAGAAHIGLNLRRRLPHGGQGLGPSLLRTALVCVIMGACVFGTTLLFGPGGSHVKYLAEVLTGTIVGLAVFVGLQAALRAPELGWLRTTLGGAAGRLRSRGR